MGQRLSGVLVVSADPVISERIEIWGETGDDGEQLWETAIVHRLDEGGGRMVVVAVKDGEQLVLSLSGRGRTWRRRGLSARSGFGSGARAR
jgi:hypothetical protein